MNEQKQKQLISDRRITAMKTLRKIENADVYCENDRCDYMDIINADSLEDAWGLYKWIDTAAREEFIKIIK